jgi:hypothetical protein
MLSPTHIASTVQHINATAVTAAETTMGYGMPATRRENG